MNAPDSPSTPQRLDRRAAIKWMMAAAAAASVADRLTYGASAAKPAAGYGSDPDLLKIYKPGDLWPLTFTPAQRATAAALCDTIIPADAKGPAASAVGVPDFIDEWISAPYPGHDADRKTVIDGLAWIEAEAQKRFQNGFGNLVTRQKNAICDDICYAPNAQPEFRPAAQFFRKFRDLTSGGYYSTPEGMKDIGYVGNVATEKFEGPPPEVLKQLGLA
ncbi:MAG: gluconate 2-dehydrogenase subunit 3 family protein [Opitutaceae bacterium]|nr:gluconate 2-dehydrogenase subunit 3 family protein [Opitutaceae bacterium]